MTAHRPPTNYGPLFPSGQSAPRADKIDNARRNAEAIAPGSHDENVRRVLAWAIERRASDGGPWRAEDAAKALGIETTVENHGHFGAVIVELAKAGKIEHAGYAARSNGNPTKTWRATWKAGTT